jgi:hypothetical protein
MALVKFGAGISEMRGKEGGVVYSRNAYGAYMKTKVSPVNPQSSSQQNVRARLQEISAAWQGLTASEKSGFASLGAIATRTNVFGDTTNYTGFGIFMRLNLNLYAVGQSMITAAPSIPSLPQLAITSVTISEAGGSMIVAFTPTPTGSGVSIVAYATPQMTAGRTFVKNLRRFIEYGSNQATAWDIVSSYQDVFTQISQGNTIHFAFKLVDEASGFDTPIVVTSAVVGA